MFLFFLITLAAATSTDQEAFNNATRKWMGLAEEILTMVSIGPLKDELTPAYLAQRSMESTLQTQAARFRSRVARSLIECVGTKATACIDPSMITDQAVQLVYAELIKHGFDVIWAKTSSLCPTVGTEGAAALVVDVPPPAPTKSSVPTGSSGPSAPSAPSA